MGNSVSTTNEGQGGYLDSAKRLETTYRDILQVPDVKRELKDLFKDMRVVVVGRSGSGKTTLIRLIVGDKGPKSMSEGTAGVQDISVEWPHPNPDLPLIFHDANGIDVSGADRLKVIKKFLDKHQKSREFSQKIHLVWYVFSAADVRFLDDGDLLGLLDTYGIPLLLIMTFNDCKNLVMQNATESNLETLLGRIKDVEKRKKVKQSMVAVGNNVRVENDGKMTGRIDVPGLKKVVERSKVMIGKKLQYTWISCQVIDMDQKLGASASLIVRYKKAEVFSVYALGALPLAKQLQLAYMFMKVLTCLCKIWSAPPNFEKAMFKSFYVDEGGHCILRNLFSNLAAALGLVVSLAVSILTAGAASPAIVGVMAAAGFAQMKATPTLLMSYSFLILGAILYVKSMQIPKDTWDADKSVEDYAKYCEEFAVSDYPKQLQKFAQESQSAWETTLRSKLQKERVKGQIIGFFNEVLCKRPNSLITLMIQNSDGAEVATNNLDEQVNELTNNLDEQVNELTDTTMDTT